MIFLDPSTSLSVSLDGAVATNQARCYASWRDTKPGELTPGFTSVDTNGTSTVSIVPAPAATYMRGVDYVNVYNEDTASIVCTIKVGSRVLCKLTVWAGETLIYTAESGWYILSAFGTVRTSINQIASPATSGQSIVILANDVINDDATANTMLDVTGLEFPLTSGKLYDFKFVCQYATNITTNGSRWSIMASAGTAALCTYQSRYSLTATTQTLNAHLQAFDSPATANASCPSTTNNLAVIEGVIRANASGSLVARFASELAGPTNFITCKAGSFVLYRQID